ncbi:MAG: DUF1320 domain-containing protein [Burkholderiaceae bacterium]
MAYLKHIDLAERPGAKELAQIASAEHGDIVESALMDATLRGADRSAWLPEAITQADATVARIDNAVAEADATIDGFLTRRGYVLPLFPVPTIVTGWSRAIARYLLHKNRQSMESTDPIVRDYRDALKLLGLTAEGKFSLGATDTVVAAAADVRFTSDPAVFDRRELKAFR